MRRHSIYIYMLVMAVADLLYTMAGLPGQNWTAAITDNQVKLVSYSLVYCKLWFFMRYTFGTTSAWTLALMSMERCLAVIAPLKARVLISRKATLVSLFTVHVIIVAYFLPTLAFAGYSSRGCRILPQYHVYHDWVKPIMAVYMPWSILLTGNLLIVLTLVLRQISQREISHSTSHVSRSSKYIRSTVATLVAVSLLFFILKAPGQVFDSSHMSKSSAYYWSTKEQARTRLIWALVVWASYFNHSVNFLVYVGGSAFKAEMKRMFQEVVGWLTGKGVTSLNETSFTSTRKSETDVSRF